MTFLKVHDRALASLYKKVGIVERIFDSGFDPDYDIRDAGGKLFPIYDDIAELITRKACRAGVQSG